MENSLALASVAPITLKNAEHFTLSPTNPYSEKVELFKKELDQCIRINLKARIKSIKRGIKLCSLAGFLHERNAVLIRESKHDGLSDLQILHPNGSFKRISRSTFRRNRISTFNGNIPMEILEKLPTNVDRNAVIFFEEKDPIIALPLGKLSFFSSKRFYIGVLKWD